MNLLLDTHMLLWAAGQPENMSEQARSLILDPANELIFSAASLWEIAIKSALGRGDFRVDARRLWRMLLANGYRELPVSGEHSVAANDLPLLHKDPFDRILVAQARVEGLTLLTVDAQVSSYGEPVLRV